MLCGLGHSTKHTHFSYDVDTECHHYHFSNTKLHYVISGVIISIIEMLNSNKNRLAPPKKSVCIFFAL